MNKICQKCEGSKPLTSFNLHSTRKDKKQAWCKDCQSKDNRFRAYGKTSEELNQLFLDQNKQCALCGITNPTGRWHVDHNHQTGVVRGILCHSCNIKLYPLENDLIWLEKAQEYLYIRRSGPSISFF